MLRTHWQEKHFRNGRMKTSKNVLLYESNENTGKDRLSKDLQQSKECYSRKMGWILVEQWTSLHFNLPYSHPLLLPTSMVSLKTSNCRTTVIVKTSSLAFTRRDKMVLELPQKCHPQKIVNFSVWQQPRKFPFRELVRSGSELTQWEEPFTWEHLLGKKNQP